MFGVVFDQHSAESAICCFVCTVCMQLRGVCYWSWRSVLPGLRLVVSVEGRIDCPEDGGEKFEFLGEGILLRESFGTVYRGREDWMFVTRMVM